MGFGKLSVSRVITLSKPMNRFLCLLACVVLFVSGCVSLVRYDGPYTGKIIDADTGEPIEGAVVLGVWNILHPNVAGGSHTFHDARETVADKEGNFRIEGMGLRILSNLEPMDLLVFKAGYEHLGPITWAELKSSYLMHEVKKVKWERGRPTILLQKMSLEEMKSGRAPSFPSEAYRKKKIPLLIRELNKIEIELGRPPYPEE